MQALQQQQQNKRRYTEDIDTEIETELDPEMTQYDDDDDLTQIDENQDVVLDDPPSVEYPYSKLTHKLTPNTEVLHEWMRANRLSFTNRGIFAEQYAILQFTCGVVPPELKKALNPHPFQRTILAKAASKAASKDKEKEEDEGGVWFVARRAPKYPGLGTADSPFDLIL
jgi:hypothetical protein